MRKHQISLNDLPKLQKILEEENKVTEKRLQTDQNDLMLRDKHLISEYEEENAKNKKVIEQIKVDVDRK